MIKMSIGRNGSGVDGVKRMHLVMPLVMHLANGQ